MDYFRKQAELLKTEREEDLKSYMKMIGSSTVAERRTNGLTWYPVAIRDTEMGKGDYLTVELERTTHQDINHQLRFGASAVLFSNHDAANDRIEGTITHQSGNKLRLSLRTDELPEWASNGKLGVDLLFDENSYEEMQHALKQAEQIVEKKEGRLAQILTGLKHPTFDTYHTAVALPRLNSSQSAAVNKIISANEIAVVHGPPGTGKTTTLVQAIKALILRDNKQILVTAPSNTAVDLLSEKLSEEGLNVLRVGNPARVSERLMSLTLDSRMAAHSSMKIIKDLKKRANEFRNMAHKYKRNFGKAEREQRRALFDEAHRIMKDVAGTEQYIMDDLLSKTQVVAATLVGANHYTVRSMKYHTAVIDEAGQALEPACWIPILKAQKLVLAGDHCQLPPTIKSATAARNGLNQTLLEKMAGMYPEAVVLLEDQYRMNEQIMGYSSDVFYDNKLKADVSVADKVLYPGAAPLEFIDTAGCGFEEKQEGTSTSNTDEAVFALKHLTLLVTALEEKGFTPQNFPSVAVISPYRQQIHILNELLPHTPVLQRHSKSISINTIDSFQGQERDIVYISLTRSNTSGEIGFLSDIRRMNVAMTRARKKLVVIGDSATLSRDSFYAGFIAYAEKHNAYISAWEFAGE